MSAARRAHGGQAGLAHIVIGLLALPLSLLPFILYASMTPEGRLVRDRVLVKIAPPSLPKLSAAQKRQAAALAPQYQGGVVALVYHGIGSGSGDGDGYVISPERFGQHLVMLKAAGLNPVTASDVARAFTGGPPLPANAVMISFDDGRSDAMMFADPLLKQARVPATMFVITGAASRPGVYYAPWGSIEKYARSGRWDIQSHTSEMHHMQDSAGNQSLPALTGLKPGESLDQFRRRVGSDLDKASSAIASHIGHRPSAFAYPFGAYGAERTNDPAIRDILREEIAKRYRVAFEQDEQDSIPLLNADQDHLLLRRLEVGNWSGSELLDRIGRIAGRNPAPGPDGALIEQHPGDADLSLLQGQPPAPPVTPGIANGGFVIPGPNGGPPIVIPAPAQLSALSSPTASSGGSSGGSAIGNTGGSTGGTGASTGGGTSTPVTTPPVTSPPVTSPPVTAGPPATSPPTTTAVPGCGRNSNGQPKKCTGGGG
jgi:peptidoglycan/xylan/chitin deacetylase (PgdA/CDA1 family)